MRPKHCEYFCERYPHITKQVYDDIEWLSIGRARSKLSTAINTRLTKYLNGWLNTGHQKGHFGKSTACPGCGWDDETQLHILQCTASNMNKKARVQAFKQCEQYYHEHKIPALVYVPFLKLRR